VASSYSRGQKAEQYAVWYLAQQGLELVTRNYRSPYGEIDIIMYHQQTLVFVEVRYRAYAHFGCAAESIDAHKQQRLYKTAQYYIQQDPSLAAKNARFDVVLICGQINKPKIDWIMNAF
jgi:putative endonuclease